MQDHLTNRKPYNVPMKKVVHAVCSHDCPDACGILVTVEDGRATRVQGDPAHPVTRGFLCAKVTKYLDRVYSPNRVMHPMRRTAPKGQGKGNAGDFTEISWDEALDEISARVADWYLPINPGTDVALALAMMNVIINEDLHNSDYVSQYTLGFEQLRQRVQEYPPERVAGSTGISAEDIRKLARDYATVRP